MSKVSEVVVKWLVNDLGMVYLLVTLLSAQVEQTDILSFFKNVSRKFHDFVLEESCIAY